MNRLLPPLVVLAVLAAVVVQCAMAPSRDMKRERVQGLIRSGDTRAALDLLEIYLDRFDDVEDRWFAAEAYFRALQPTKAIDVIWKDPELRADPQAQRRFAEIGLFALGWRDERRTERGIAEPPALLALVEGGNAWAEARLLEEARTLPLEGTTTYFFPAFRMATARPMEVIVKGYRMRADPKLDVAAAMAELRPEPYPERAKDLQVVKAVVASSQWRTQRPEVWRVCCLALGRSEDPGGLDLLRRQERLLGRGRKDYEQIQRLEAMVGLMAAGVKGVKEQLDKEIQDESTAALIGTWYLEALIHRWRQGDQMARSEMLKIWNTKGSFFEELRHRVGMALLLQYELPDPNDPDIQAMLKIMRDPEAPLLGRVLAEAYRLRRGEMEARDALLDVMREVAKAFLKASNREKPVLSDAFLTGLRGLYLYPEHRTGS